MVPELETKGTRPGHPRAARAVRDYGLLTLLGILTFAINRLVWSSTPISETVAFTATYGIVLVAFDLPPRVRGGDVTSVNLFSREASTSYRFVSSFTALTIASITALIAIWVRP
jgi:hypothetical protein